jgi:hypothetical protein
MRIGGIETPILTKSQRILENKLGLSERACAKPNESAESMQDVNGSLEKGELDPGFFRKILLKLAELVGGPKYDAAVQQFRLSRIFPRISGENKEIIFTDLATAMLSCKPDKINDVCQVIYDLFGEDPDIRRGFFCNKLTTLCNAQMSNLAESDDPQNFVEFVKKIVSLNAFCSTHNLDHTKVSIKKAQRRMKLFTNHLCWQCIIS